MSFLRGIKPKTKSSPEGKSMADQEKVCQVCEENNAKMFCTSCFEALCKICAKSHARYFGTNHIVTDLTDITESKMVPKSAEENPELRDCIRHSGNQVSHVCKQCVILGCDKCFESNEHKQHDVVMLEGESNLIMELCNNNVKSLLDKIATVEKISPHGDVSEESIDSAIQLLIQKHKEITKSVDSCVTSSIARLEEQKRQISNEKKRLGEFAASNIEIMEFSVLQLNTARKTRSIHQMVDEITKSDHIMNDVDKFLGGNCTDMPVNYSVRDILPEMDEYDSISGELVNVFDAILPLKSTEISEVANSQDGIGQFEYSGVELDKSTVLALEYEMAVESHGINDLNQVVMYAPNTCEVSIVNYTSGAIKKLKADCEINDICLKVSSTRYVVDVDGDDDQPSKLKLLDAKFKTLDTIGAPDDMEAMCCLGMNGFVVYAEHDTSPHNTLDVYEIVNDKLKVKYTVQIGDKLRPDKSEVYHRMCPNPTNDQIILIHSSVYASGDKWFQCTIVNLHSRAILRQYEGAVGMDLPFIDKNGDLLVSIDFRDNTVDPENKETSAAGDTEDDSEDSIYQVSTHTSGEDQYKIRVYRNIENGFDEYEDLENVEVDDDLSGIVRHGDKLILGFYDRVECFSLQSSDVSDDFDETLKM